MKGQFLGTDPKSTLVTVTLHGQERSIPYPFSTQFLHCKPPCLFLLVSWLFVFNEGERAGSRRSHTDRVMTAGEERDDDDEMCSV